MRVERQCLEGVTVVSVAEPGEVDAGNADAFGEAILAAAEGADKVVLDLATVDFLDSAGMGALLHVQKRLTGRGAQMVLAGLNRAVQEVFQMVGFDVVFKIFPSAPDAVAALRK